MRKPSTKYGTLLLYKDNAQIASKIGEIFPIFFEFVVFFVQNRRRRPSSRRFLVVFVVNIRKITKTVRSAQEKRRNRTKRLTRRFRFYIMKTSRRRRRTPFSISPILTGVANTSSGDYSRFFPLLINNVFLRFDARKVPPCPPTVFPFLPAFPPTVRRLAATY